MGEDGEDGGVLAKRLAHGGAQGEKRSEVRSVLCCALYCVLCCGVKRCCVVMRVVVLWPSAAQLQHEPTRFSSFHLAHPGEASEQAAERALQRPCAAGGGAGDDDPQRRLLVGRPGRGAFGGGGGGGGEGDGDGDGDGGCCHYYQYYRYYQYYYPYSQ